MHITQYISQAQMNTPTHGRQEQACFVLPPICECGLRRLRRSHPLPLRCLTHTIYMSIRI